MNSFFSRLITAIVAVILGYYVGITNNKCKSAMESLLSDGVHSAYRSSDGKLCYTLLSCTEDTKLH